MSDYLLSPRSLLDRLSGKQGYAIDEWLDEQPRSSSNINISLISIGLAQEAIGSAESELVRSQFGEALSRTIRVFPKNCILPVDEPVIVPWTKLLSVSPTLVRYSNRDDTTEVEELSDAELLVVATALAYKLTLVEPQQPYHKVLSTYDLKIETLGE